MVGILGSILLGMACLFSAYFVVTSFMGVKAGREKWLASAHNASIAVTFLCGISLVILVLSFLSNHFEINYVAQHSSLALPIYLKISAVWAGQEGSLLLWCFLQALFVTIAIRPRSQVSKELVPWTGVILSLILLFFLAINLIFSNPFITSATIPTDGMGLNAVLRHPGMILHPPILYIGYVALSIPFAFALSAALNRKLESWSAGVHGWILLGWFGLGLGLLLGMRWSYDVLGWGGYWDWDPVENTGLLPWLAATGLLHGSVIQDEKHGFWKWNYWLAVFSFVFVLLGTFTTRSGLVQSVHAYSQSNLGTILLVGMFAALIGALIIFILRSKSFPSRNDTPDLFSRDGLFFLTLLLISTVTISILVGSLLPTIVSAVSAKSIALTPDWFDKVTGPQFVGILLLIGVCPLLGRAISVYTRFKKYWWVGIIGIVLVDLLAIWFGFIQPLALVGFSIAGLATAYIIFEILVEPFLRQPGETRPAKSSYFSRLLPQQRKYGGYLVHLGIVLIGIGIIGTRNFPFEQNISLMKNQSTENGGYTFLFEGFSQENLIDHTRISALLQVSQNGRHLATLQPLVDSYGEGDQTITSPAIYSTIRNDLYVITAGWTGGGETATFRVYINPLINFLWAGALVLLGGGALALWPKNRKRYQNILLAIVLILSLAAGGWLMWGMGHGRTQVNSTGQLSTTTSNEMLPLQISNVSSGNINLKAAVNPFSNLGANILRENSQKISSLDFPPYISPGKMRF